MAVETRAEDVEVPDLTTPEAVEALAREMDEGTYCWLPCRDAAEMLRALSSALSAARREAEEAPDPSLMMGGGRPWWTPEQRAAADAHWARVRAGMHEPEAHVWKDSLDEMIDRHNALAAASFAGAARHLRHVEELRTVETEHD